MFIRHDNGKLDVLSIADAQQTLTDTGKRLYHIAKDYLNDNVDESIFLQNVIDIVKVECTSLRTFYAAVAYALGKSTDKYPLFNYMYAYKTNGIKRIVNAALRHNMAMNKGIMFAGNSSITHRSHYLANLYMLANALTNRIVIKLSTAEQ